MKTIRTVLAVAVAGVVLFTNADVVLAWDSEYPESTSPYVDKKGHNWITLKALEYLSDWGLLPKEMDSPDEQNLIIYGVHFADNPWLGRPESPDKWLMNHMTTIVTYPTAPGLEDPVVPAPKGGAAIKSEDDSFSIGKIGTDFEGRATLEWTRPALCQVARGGYICRMNSSRPSVAMLLRFEILNDGDGVREEFGQDNLYHYPYDDLQLLGESNISASDNDVRLYPLNVDDLDTNDLENWVAGRDLVSSLRNKAVVSGVEFGTSKYGPILYQLARKFFDMSHAEPSLDDLVYASNDVAGWRTGGVYPGSPMESVQLDFPSTYLGGMPFICDNSNPSDPTDVCKGGNPTWPSWLPAEYNVPLVGSTEEQREAFLAKLTQKRPGRAKRGGLIYLGWALHMIQDSSQPHHAANWTGFEHKKIDEYATEIAAMDAVSYCPDGSVVVSRHASYGGCIVYCTSGQSFAADPRTRECPSETVSIDDYMRSGLEDLLGPVNAPHSRDAVCGAVGIEDNQIVSGTLNWEAVQPLFLETIRRAYYARTARMTGNEYALSHVRNAIHDSIRLLLCAPATTLSPALIMTTVSVTAGLSGLRGEQCGLVLEKA